MNIPEKPEKPLSEKEIHLGKETEASNEDNVGWTEVKRKGNYCSLVVSFSHEYEDSSTPPNIFKNLKAIDEVEKKLGPLHSDVVDITGSVRKRKKKAKASLSPSF